MSAFCRAVAACCLSGCLILPSAAFGFDLFKKENADVKEGNALLKQGKPDKAIASYNRAAQSLPKNHAVNLDRGLALSRLGDQQFDDAVYAFKMAAESHGPPPIRSRALANLGNAFFKKEDYAEAIDYYKKSLLLSPGNKDVAWNLELAVQRKKEVDKKQDQENKDQKKDNQQNKDQQNKDQQNKDQKKEDQQKKEEQDKDKKKEEEKKEQEKKDQEKKEKEKQEQQKKNQKEEEKKAPKPEQLKTKQEVEQLLDSLDNQKDNLQKKMAEKRAAAMPAGRFKDW